MFKWFKSIFNKEDITQDIKLPNIPTNPELPNFAEIIAEQIRIEVDAVKQAEDEIKLFESLTQVILKDLEPTIVIENNIFYYPYENPKIRIARIGRVINDHVKRAEFNKKVNNIISNED
jgi:hypothetical protein